MPLPLLFALLASPPADSSAVVASVVAAFASHRIVAIGENHGHREFHDVILELLEDPRAVEAIDDVAVEWGNALYQDVMDRYVAGEAVPWDSVTMAWRNTIVSPNTVWDAPVYERFFRAVRRINQEFPPEDHYRVLLADAPVDWSSVHRREDLQPYLDRAEHMADVVRRESLLRGRRTLFLAGGLHVSRLPRVRQNGRGIPVAEITPVAWLEFRHPGVTYVIQSMGRARELGLEALRGAGATPLALRTTDPRVGTVRANRATTLRNRDGSAVDVYGEGTLADIVDEVILWGDTRTTFEEPAASSLTVPWYREELDRRRRILQREGDQE
jgi:hypothetical protein